MTDHYFENDWVQLHYYKFGSGSQAMLCFHGFGMHGRQFKPLEPTLGEQYTFYGFDLFFHKETRLNDQSLAAVKKGLSKTELAKLISDFCIHCQIERFSVIGYSMGTHYASTIAEQMPARIDEYILAAPMCLYPGKLISFFSKSKFGNSILEKMALSDEALINLIGLFRRLRLINSEAYHILSSEVETAELRFNLYACFTYLRFLEMDQALLSRVLEEHKIKCIFIFGKHDKSFPPGIGRAFISKLSSARVLLLDEGHEMIKKSFVSGLTDLLI